MNAQAAPVGRIAVGGIARLVLAPLAIGGAALIVLGVGGGLRGSVGSLFGFEGDRGARQTATVSPSPVTALGELPITPAPDIADVNRHARAPVARRRNAVRSPVGDRTPGAPAPAPAQPQQPTPPVAPGVPRPTPQPGGAVETVTKTVDDTAKALPAPVQQPVRQVLDTVAGVCIQLGGCP